MSPFAPQSVWFANLGKQKFEVITLICPASDFVATLDTRFMLLGDFLCIAKCFGSCKDYNHEHHLRARWLERLDLGLRCVESERALPLSCVIKKRGFTHPKVTTDTLTEIHTGGSSHWSMSLEDML